VIATAFDHYDSRAGDPHLHTHVVISNKVQTVHDGKWRSRRAAPARRDRRPVGTARSGVRRPPHPRLRRRVGSRDMGRDRNPAWAISTVPEDWWRSSHPGHGRSMRRRTGSSLSTLPARRQPSLATIIKLRAQATLAPDRRSRCVRSRPHREWRDASHLLGEDATHWARTVTANDAPRLLRADDAAGRDRLARAQRGRGGR
jgi:hypothetical protein